MLSDMTSESKQGVRQQAKERTRQALLAAARRVLNRRGLAGTTTREIAAEAGVAAGTFFVHFPDMNLLIETLLDEHVEQALRQGLRSIPDGAGLMDQLLHVAAALYRSYDAEPEMARQYLSATLFHSHPGGPAEQRLIQFRGWVTERIAQARSDGQIGQIDPELAFAAYFALYFGFLVAGLRGELDRTRQLALLKSSLQRLFLLEDHQ